MQEMTRTDAKEFVRTQKPDFLQRAKDISGKPSYICPICGNGSGSSGTGITTKDGVHYKCFKCNLSADVIDLIGLHYGLQDGKEKFEKAYEYYSVEVIPDKEERNALKENETQEGAGGYDSDNIALCVERAAAQARYGYLENRGISEDTQRFFNVGFIKAWKHPKAGQKVPASPRCIIPIGNTGYLARDTRPELTETERQYAKMRCGKMGLFNPEALQRSSIVFCAEGEIDAMSIYECGGDCIGLCSTVNKQRFIDYVKKHDKGHVIILALDNDAAGREAQAEIKEALEAAKIPVLEMQYAEKDPNEALMKARGNLAAKVSSLKDKARLLQLQRLLPHEYNARLLLEYFREMEKRPEVVEVKTGFSLLDYNLFGGLHAGLIILGAISALGKTTFALQVADQIAAARHSVLFFSLEMAKYELLAKSISRQTYIEYGRDADANGNNLAKETMQLLNNRLYKAYTDDEKDAIAGAIESYSAAAGNVFIYEGRHNGHRLTVADIRRIVDTHYRTMGEKPVVIVDYLQILGTSDTRLTDKQATDAAVYELKEISRDYDIPVIAVSSFNRENYLEPVSMASFKESGAIEFSADILLGLQYAGLDYLQGETAKDRSERLRELNASIWQKKKAKEPIEIELKCLKNRNGYQFTIPFELLAAYNYFAEMPEDAEGLRPCLTSTPFDNAVHVY